MSETTILKVDDLNAHAQGDGVETMLLLDQGRLWFPHYDGVHQLSTRAGSAGSQA